MKQPWKVAIATQLSSDPDRKAFEGAVSYGVAHPGFQFRAIRFLDDEEVPIQLQKELFDGAIINILPGIYAPLADQFPSIPMVNIGVEQPSPTIPTVKGPSGQGSQTILTHLRKQGYRRFGYVAPFPEESQDPRIPNLRGLLTAEEGSLPVHYLPGFDYNYVCVDEQVEALADWLKGLVKESLPTAIITLDAYRSAAIVLACQRLELAIPAEVGIVSYVDSRACITQTPPITSLEVPAFELGYAAMHQLHQLLEGNQPPAQSIEIPGGRVIIRASTADPEVYLDEIEFVVEFMQKNLGSNISVTDCLREIETVSRASFYRSFSRQMGMSPAEYLRSLKIKRAKELLISTANSVASIAKMTGFSSRTQFGSTFKQVVGESPSQYRRSMQGQQESPSSSQSN